jgi:hypothetical protein
LSTRQIQPLKNSKPATDIKIGQYPNSISKDGVAGGTEEKYSPSKLRRCPGLIGWKLRKTFA